MKPHKLKENHNENRFHVKIDAKQHFINMNLIDKVCNLNGKIDEKLIYLVFLVTY
jgi:hypothetical protein